MTVLVIAGNLLMADRVQFELVTPERLIVSREVEMVVVPGSEGNFGVLPGHAPLISTIRPGTIDIYEGRAITERIFVVGGIAEVTPERCTVLADEAMAPDALDRAALDRELTEVEGNLPSLREQVARAQGTERERLAGRAAPSRTPAERRPRQAPGARRNRPLRRPSALRGSFPACLVYKTNRLHRPRGGGMGSWTLDDIPWDRFDPAKLDPEIVRIVKAASLVEHNGAAYAHHLCRIFADDPAFQETARRWGEEEIQHGEALARWAALADPGFDFARAFARFQEGFQVDFDSDRSRRGSRAGEMVARCIVEIGTSAYYSALREAAVEPVLQEICRHIAADELRHYRLFYKNLDRCLERERIGRLARLRVALGRIAESEDDELAYAYYAANEDESPL